MKNWLLLVLGVGVGHGSVTRIDDRLVPEVVRQYWSVGYSLAELVARTARAVAEVAALQNRQHW